MNFKLLTFAILSVPFLASADDVPSKFYVWQKNGSVIPYVISEVDSISFARVSAKVSLISGQDAQIVKQNELLSPIAYEVQYASSVVVKGLPKGVDFHVSSGNNGLLNVSIEGTPREAGEFPFSVVTMGGADETTVSGIILVEEAQQICSSTATELAAKMNLGINIGNTFEVCADWLGTNESNETGWGSPVITKKMIENYKNFGFNTIRIPVSWNYYASANGGVIPDFWKNRIKEVVEWCMEYDLYVILNIHWDKGWLEEHVDASSKNSVNATQKNLWIQIANHFNEFDERLVFASSNEPGRTANDENNMILKSYHQTFVDAVRATGGYNASRCLIVQCFNTSSEECVTANKILPTDVIENRLMMEFHYYPYTYALMEEDADWGRMDFFWGEPYKGTSINGVERWCDWNTEQTVEKEFSSIKNTYVKLGVPVIMGEFQAMNRDKNLSGNDLAKFEENRNYYYNFLVKTAKNNGIVPVLWDTPDNLFDRSAGTCLHPKALDGLLKGASEGKYPW